MCGISGVIRFDGGTVSPPEVERFCRAMHHRGPDQSGTYTDAQRGLSVGFGTVRLAIQDLSPAGSQPMASADSKHWIAFNGEIYNHPALKAELERQGAQYRSRSDTETLLHGYRIWGPGFVDRLDGIFAFALYDQPASKILIARYRMGIKPLYYYRTPDAIYFASELKVLLTHPDVPRAIDRRTLHLYLTLGYVPSPHCLIEGVRKLEPGTTMTVEAGGRISFHTYWRIPQIDPLQASRSDEDLQHELRSLMEETVAEQLISDVPVGSCLSGGIDSTLITALAQRHHEGPLDTFSVGFKAGQGQAPIHPMYNLDLEHAREVAKELGTRHHEVLIETGPALLDELPKMVAHVDEPVWEGSFISIYRISKLARDNGIIVLLAGDGSDELFGGYPHIVGAMQHAQVERRIERNPLLRAALPLTQPFLGNSAMGQRVRMMRERMKLGPAELYRQRQEMIPEDLRAALLGERISSVDLLNDVLSPAIEGPDAPYTEFLMRADLHLWVREHFNQRIDRMSMAVSVEARVPFQGNRLIDFAMRLPLPRKAAIGEAKRLLRRACADVIPESVLNRPKRPYNVPGDAWLLGESGQALREMLSPERVRATGMLEPSAVSQVIERSAEFGQWANHRVWTLLWLQLWAEQMLGARAATAA